MVTLNRFYEDLETMKIELQRVQPSVCPDELEGKARPKLSNIGEKDNYSTKSKKTLAVQILSDTLG